MDLALSGIRIVTIDMLTDRESSPGVSSPAQKTTIN